MQLGLFDTPTTPTVDHAQSQALCQYCGGQMQQIGEQSWACQSNDVHRFYIWGGMGVWKSYSWDRLPAGLIPAWAVAE